MLIGQIFFRRVSIVLRDVDGSEETLTYDDALDLHVRLLETERRREELKTYTCRDCGKPLAYLETIFVGNSQYCTDHAPDFP